MKAPRWTPVPTLLLGLLLGLAGCSAQRHDMDGMTHGAPAVAGRPVLYDSLGSYSYPITTASPETQRWFDQGLRLVYAFNQVNANDVVGSNDQLFLPPVPPPSFQQTGNWIVPPPNTPPPSPPTNRNVSIG